MRERINECLKKNEKKNKKNTKKPLNPANFETNETELFKVLNVDRKFTK